MTRINIYPVSELSNQHLLAEHRELKRIPNQILCGRFNLNNQPKSYCMRQGHVKFFYDKLKFLHLRYIELYNECTRRGFNVTNFEKSFLYILVFESYDVQKRLYNDYTPLFDDYITSQERINQKLADKPDFYKFY
jgi:hypothetical protein